MMGGKILRETFDRNLNQVLRLRTLENGKNFFTAIPKGTPSPGIKCLSKPIFTHICITRQCNLACPYCYANDRSSTEDMTSSELSNLIDMCDANEILSITWTGGEPFLSPFFHDAIVKTHNYGMHQTILTNGTQLDRLLLQNYPKDNISFQVSLNNVWDDTKGHDKVIANVARALKEGYEIVLTIMLEPLELSCYEDLFHILIRNGIPSARLGFKIPVGKAENQDSVKYENEIKRIVPGLISLKQKLANQINLSYQFDPQIFTSKGFPRRFIICRAATTEIYINNNGDVYPCPLFKSYSEFYCGNILHDKWEEIWSADPMKIIREVSECCDCKYNCGVWCRALKYSMDGDLHGRSHYCLKEIQYVL